MKKATKNKLDRIFSKYIRRRDSNEEGYGQCISCGKWIHWKDADAGHFINRRHMNLRYSEENVNLQCKVCNRFDEGNPIGYMRGLKEKYGDGIIEVLEAKKQIPFKMDEFTAQRLIDCYNQKFKALC